MTAVSLRRIGVRLAVFAVVFALGGGLLATASAASYADWTGPTAGPPVPGAGLPPAARPADLAGVPAGYDLPGEYEGQRSCSPSAKPGALRLAAMIRQAYGSDQTVWIPRACDVGGRSEHKEGRALDWMTSRRVPQQRANAEAFLSWLLGPDELGNPYGRAVRLGVMYIGWNDRIWRAYGIDRGWTELKGCFATPQSSHDTLCHRDHVHVSLTWDGAAARTSGFDGSPVTVRSCDSRPSSASRRQLGRAAEMVPLSPVRVFDSTASLGVPVRCRPSQESEEGDLARMFIPVAGATGVPLDAAAVRVRVGVLAANAPTLLRVNTPGADNGAVAVRVGLNEDGVGEAIVPIGSDGTIGVSVMTGSADVRVDVLGFYPAGPLDNTVATGFPQGSSAMASDPASGPGGPPPAVPAPSTPGASDTPPGAPVPSPSGASRAFVPLGSTVAVPLTSLPSGVSRLPVASVPADAARILAMVTLKQAARGSRVTVGGAPLRVRRGASSSLAVLDVSSASVRVDAPSPVTVRIDALGYAPGRLKVRPLRPVTIAELDMPAGSALPLGPLPGVGGLPARARAAVFKVSVTSDALGNVTVLPFNGVSPGTSSAPAVPGRTQVTLVASALGADGLVTLTSSGAARVRVELVGFVRR